MAQYPYFNAHDLLPSAQGQGSTADPVRAHPTRPMPNPVDGSLFIDPEIELMALGMGLEVGFYYSTAAKNNGPYGTNRSSSVSAGVTAASINTSSNVTVWRGNLDQFTYFPTSSSGSDIFYTPLASTYSPTTLMWDGAQFLEYFPDGSSIKYAHSVTAGYLITEAISPAGAIQTFTYGGAPGLLQTISVPDGRVVSFLYGAGTPTSLLSAVEDWGGRRWSFAYDSGRNMTTYTTPLGCQTGYSYAVFGSNTLVYSATDPRGFTSYFGYDSTGRVVTTLYGTAMYTFTYGPSGNPGSTQESPTGAITTYTANFSGQIAAIQWPEGYTSSFTYDSHGFQASETVPSGTRFSQIFDAQGRVLVSQDPLGFVTTYQRDGYGNPTTTIDALGNYWTQVFDSSFHRLATVDPLGRRNSWTYDNYGQMLTAQDGRGLTTSFLYDGFANPTTQINSDGGIITRTFDVLNRKLSETDPIGRATTWAYDVADNVTALTIADGAIQSFIYNTCLLAAKVDQLGFRTSYTYGRYQNQLTKQNALGFTWSSLYDTMGYPTGTVDPLGNQTTTTYNAARQRTADFDQLGYATSYFYDRSARPLATLDALGYRTSTVYNARDAIARQDALGFLWTTTYDALARPVAATSPLCFTNSTVFDTAGQSIASIDPLGFRTSSVFDNAGNRTESIDSNGFITTSAYSATSNRLAASIDPNGFATSNIYDLAGQQLSRQNALGYYISFAYDQVGRQAAITNEISLTTTYLYEPRGLRQSRQFPNGDITQYGYDAVRQSITSVYADGTILTLGYEPRRLRTTMVDVTGTTTFAFDPRSSMTGKTDPGSLTQAYVYDQVVNRTKLVDPDGGTRTYTFDALRRPVSMEVPSGQTYTAQYDANGRPTTLVQPAVHQVSSFDPVGRETTIIQTESGGALSTIVDAFDGAGRKTSHTVDGLTTSYFYDPGTRLTGQQGTGVWATMAYDPVGNTTLKWNQGSNPMTMTYNPSSQLATMVQGAVNTTYVFDLNGNTTVERSGGVSTGYSFEKENRMKQVQHSDGTLSSYTYSGDGLRRTRQEPTDSAQHTIVWDGSDYLGEY